MAAPSQAITTTGSGHPSPQQKTYIVEHLDPELGAWSQLEYLAIARECQASGSKFCLSSLPAGFEVPGELSSVPSFVAESRGVEELHPEAGGRKARVCLLDPKAEADLSPGDGELFDVFLFGGILGTYEIPFRSVDETTHAVASESETG